MKQESRCNSGLRRNSGFSGFGFPALYALALSWRNPFLQIKGWAGEDENLLCTQSVMPRLTLSRRHWHRENNECEVEIRMSQDWWGYRTLFQGLKGDLNAAE